MRLVAVFGYSRRRFDGMHDVCAERVRHAEGLEADAVLLSGEAELMRAAWNGTDAAIHTDGAARNTRENALGVAEASRRLGATEVVVVTSRWHALRARTLVRSALPGVPVSSSSPPTQPPLALLAREVVCVAALPYQMLRLRGLPGPGR
jgi:uncharacterized SAM-binding protein YcdF (DUF218 family)